jgi:hypothetical protein
VRAEINPTAEGPDAAPPMPVAGTVGPAPPPVVMPGKPDAAAAPPSPAPEPEVALGGPKATGPRAATAGAPTWTIFVYGHGDHNLSPALLRDFAEMNRAQLTDNVRVVFFSDWKRGHQDPDGDGRELPGGCVLVPGGGQPDQGRGGGRRGRARPRQPDGDGPREIELGFRAYPADRYGLIMWDHGGSWFGGFGGDTDNETHEGNPLSVDQVPAA